MISTKKACCPRVHQEACTGSEPEPCGNEFLHPARQAGLLPIVGATDREVSAQLRPDRINDTLRADLYHRQLIHLQVECH